MAGEFSAILIHELNSSCSVPFGREGNSVAWRGLQAFRTKSKCGDDESSRKATGKVWECAQSVFRQDVLETGLGLALPKPLTGICLLYLAGKMHAGMERLEASKYATVHVGKGR